MRPERTVAAKTKERISAVRVVVLLLLIVFLRFAMVIELNRIQRPNCFMYLRVEV